MTQTVPVPGAMLWSPDNPFLYMLDTSTGGDSRSTRFGMREFRFDSPTAARCSTARSIYLRGIEHHACTASSRIRNAAGCPGTRRGCGSCSCDIPKQMHWNSLPHLHRARAAAMAGHRR